MLSLCLTFAARCCDVCTDTIYNNTFEDVQTGIMIGGGRRNHVKWNHFQNCTTGIEFDNRGARGTCESSHLASICTVLYVSIYLHSLLFSWMGAFLSLVC